MNEQKTASYTPGPWDVEAEDNNNFICDENGHTVAQIYERSNADVNHANARLIAAAPELLLMCKTLLGLVMAIRSGVAVDLDSVHAEAYAALNKATGAA